MDELEKVWGEQLEDFKKAVNFSEIIYMEDIFFNWLKTNELRGRALDQGCGTGFYTIMLSRFGFETTGVEISKILLEECKRNLDKLDLNAELVKRDIRDMLFENDYFDLIVSGGIVEHFPETEKALDEISRVLKKDGVLLIHVPHMITSFTLLKKIQQLLGLWKIGYEKSFTKRKFRKMLEKRGLKVVKFSLPSLKPSRSKFVYFVMKFLNFPLELIGLGGHHMFFYCVKK